MSKFKKLGPSQFQRFFTNSIRPVFLVLIFFGSTSCNKKSDSASDAVSAQQATTTTTTTTTLPTTSSTSGDSKKETTNSTGQATTNPDLTPKPSATGNSDKSGQPTNNGTSTATTPTTSSPTSKIPTSIHPIGINQKFETQEEKLTRICNLEFRSIDELNESRNTPCLTDLDAENAYKLTQLMRIRFNEVTKKLNSYEGRQGQVIIAVAKDTFWWIFYGALLPSGTLIGGKTSAAGAKALERWNTSKGRVEELQKWAERHKLFSENAIKWSKSSSVMVILTGIASSVATHKEELINIVLKTPEEVKAAKVIFEFLKSEAERRSIVLETFKYDDILAPDSTANPAVPTAQGH